MSIEFVPLNRSDQTFQKPVQSPIPLKPAAPFMPVPETDKPVRLEKDNEPKSLSPTFKDIYLHKRQELQKSADGMEGILVRQVLKTMRSTIPLPEGDDDIFGSASHATQMFTQMMDDQLADKMAANGNFGIADRIFKSHINLLTQEFADQVASGRTTPYGIPLPRR